MPCGVFSLCSVAGGLPSFPCSGGGGEGESGVAGGAPFVVANSMREVQPEINLLVSPIKENLVYIAPPGAPIWVLPEEAS